MSRSPKKRGRVSSKKFLDRVAWFSILVIRGCGLWVLVPLAFVAWLLVHRWAQNASLRQAVSWYDLNLISILANGPFRLAIVPQRRPPLVGIASMDIVDPHRIKFTDLN